MTDVRISILPVLMLCGLAVLVCRGCFGKSDEIGSLGMDLTGRQVLLQTPSTATPEGVTITSEWGDYNFLQRLWQQPMHTTFRIEGRAGSDEVAMWALAEAVGEPGPRNRAVEFLDSPFEVLIEGYREKITVRADLEVPIEEFRGHCREKGIKTVRDLLGGMGFKRYQCRVDGKEIYCFDLPTKNLVCLGGNLAPSSR